MPALGQWQFFLCQEEEAKQLVRDAIAAGIYNDLGSGSNIDICVISKNKLDFLRPYDVANRKGDRWGILKHLWGVCSAWQGLLSVIPSSVSDLQSVGLSSKQCKRAAAAAVNRGDDSGRIILELENLSKAPVLWFLAQMSPSTFRAHWFQWPPCQLHGSVFVNSFLKLLLYLKLSVIAISTDFAVISFFTSDFYTKFLMLISSKLLNASFSMHHLPD